MRNRHHRHNFGALSVAVLLLTSGAAAAALAAGGPSTAPTTKPLPKFLRFVDEPNRTVLETSTVTYRNARGQTVDLVAAVHVADPSFYKSLNDSFRQYDALLYEMVKPKEMGAPEPGQTSGSWISMLQRGMQETLRLEYQLDGIDYTRPNFVHADMDVDTFQQRQAARNESFFQLFMRTFMQQMARQASQPENASAAQPDIFAILAALRDPEGARELKIMLAQQFASMDDILAGIEGPQGSVIVSERNQACMKVLDEQLERNKRKLGIFFGAAHLEGMEKLLQQRGFKQVGEPKWRVAWDMTAPPSTRPTTRPAAMTH